MKRQRHQYILLVEKKKESSTLTSERIRLLEKIGFDWRCLNSAWENNYKELCRYSLLNGHWYVIIDDRIIEFISSYCPYRTHMLCMVDCQSWILYHVYSAINVQSDTHWLCTHRTLLCYTLYSHVPSTYKKNTKLASWVILQRRYDRFFCDYNYNWSECVNCNITCVFFFPFFFSIFLFCNVCGFDFTNT